MNVCCLYILTIVEHVRTSVRVVESWEFPVVSTVHRRNCRNGASGVHPRDTDFNLMRESEYANGQNRPYTVTVRRLFNPLTVVASIGLNSSTYTIQLNEILDYLVLFLCVHINDTRFSKKVCKYTGLSYEMFQICNFLPNFRWPQPSPPVYAERRPGFVIYQRLIYNGKYIWINYFNTEFIMKLTI